MSEELSRRSGRAELAAWDGNEPTIYSDLLEAQACGGRRSHGAWRVVELFGDGGPFEAHLRWTAGEGAGQHVFVTVPRNTRLSVFAHDLVIEAANLYGGVQNVGCMVSDGYAATLNYFEQRGSEVGGLVGGGAGSTTFEIPPFGRVVHLEAQDPLTLGNYSLGVLDGMNVLRAKWAGNDQPQGGMPLGGALKLEVNFPAGAVYRLVHALNL